MNPHHRLGRATLGAAATVVIAAVFVAGTATAATAKTQTETSSGGATANAANAADIANTASNLATDSKRSAAVLNAVNPDTLPNRFIVVLRDDKVQPAGVTAAVADLAERYGGRATRSYSAALRGFAATMTEEQASKLATDPLVSFVERDQIMRADATQASPPWGLDRIDQRTLPLDLKYGYSTTAATVRAYVIDSGVRISHTQFAGRASNGWDFIDNDAVAQDCHGHGTHVAGTIAGSTYGVAKAAKVVGVRVLGCDGSGSNSTVIAGVDWVTAHAIKPAVANMSLGGAGSEAVDLAVNRSIANGITYALAAGNGDSQGVAQNACNYSPARVPMGITVGAIGSYGSSNPVSNARASFSNYGTCVDIFAPGVGIRSAAISGDTASVSMSGTSMAAPHIAGAAALLLAAHPAYTPRQVTESLVTGSTKNVVLNPGTGSPNRLLYTGAYTYTPAPACATRTNSTVMAIPDPGTVNSKIAYTTCAGTASAMSTVRVKILHPWRDDLQIKLISPAGVAYLLKSATYSAEVANVDAIYLVNLAGKTRNGTWTLRVTDTMATDAGQLVTWTLAL